ncbi:MAG TPA: hypothetical protein VFD29_02660 [Gillisia sp.]|nr:hypothetical protein [Gillisia sp.]
MKKLFKNKYQSDTSRLKGWDYSNPGQYFITICPHNRDHLFGEIKGGEMELSDFGQITLQEWWKSFEIRAELFCDAFVIMPNHIHGIVRIDKIIGDGLILGTNNNNKTTGWHIVPQNRFPHLWPDLNHLPPKK